MLSYAFQSLNFKEYNKVKSEDFDNIYDLFSNEFYMGFIYFF